MNRKKAELRKQILKARNALLPEQRQVWDRKILQRLIEYDKKSPCPVYLCYVSYKSEVSTKEFICWCLENGKKVFVPKVLAEETLPEMEFYRLAAWEELKKGYQGILEPEAHPERALGEYLKKVMLSKQIKMTDMSEKEEGFEIAEVRNSFRFRMLLPGAVFDKAGNRIGYGGGFYDRWLAKWNGFQYESITVPLDRKGFRYGCTEKFVDWQNWGYSPARMLEKIGLAYQMQIVDKIPAEAFDQRTCLIITEENIIDTIREDKNDT